MNGDAPRVSKEMQRGNTGQVHQDGGGKASTHTPFFVNPWNDGGGVQTTTQGCETQGTFVITGPPIYFLFAFLCFLEFLYQLITLTEEEKEIKY